MSKRTKISQGLVVPAVLVLSSFGPGCGGKEGPMTAVTTEQAETSPTAPTGAVPTTGTGTTSAPTTGTSTGSTGSATTGGELPDCSMFNNDAVTCLSMIPCLYLDNEGVCIVRCNYFPDQASCEMQDFCYWEGGCYLAV